VAKTVLLIEDNEQNVYLMKFLLNAHELEVTVARDGHEGIRLAETLSPDIILLDIQLPTITGYDVARILREDDRFDDVPIIAVTSYAMPGDREKAVTAGCNGYIEKPINPDTFINQLNEYLPDCKAD
jgi:CheY-like chemotaxis protein